MSTDLGRGRGPSGRRSTTSRTGERARADAPVAGSRSHGSRSHGARSHGSRTASPRAGAARSTASRTTARSAATTDRPSAGRTAAPRAGVPPRRQVATTPPPRTRHRRVKSARRRAPGITMTFRAGEPRKRLVAVFVVATLLFLAVVARVAFLQTAGSDSLRAAGKAQRVSEAVLFAPRGTIFARDGGELVLSVPSSTIIRQPEAGHRPHRRIVGAGHHARSQRGEAAVVAERLHAEGEELRLRRSPDRRRAWLRPSWPSSCPGSTACVKTSGSCPAALSAAVSSAAPTSTASASPDSSCSTTRQLTGTDGERVREHDAKGRSIPGSGATTTEPDPRRRPRAHARPLVAVPGGAGAGQRVRS
jgi:hypothetical protein